MAQSEGASSNVKSRLVEWTDPTVAADAARRMSGLQFLQSFVAGEIDAPVCPLIGFRPTSVSEGTITFELQPDSSQYNLIGVVHGGIVATLLDSAMGCAVHSRLPSGIGYATLEINVHYVRGVTQDVGPLRCVGSVVSMGSRVATARATLVDRDERLYAHGTSVCLIIRDEAGGASGGSPATR